MSSTRQLAAVMFTDIVGYTALMGEDEKKAFELLRSNRQLQKTWVESYGGRWIKELGDGTLATFPTVLDAVTCACKLIKESEEIEGLQLRIGIHLGDVIFENNDVFGDSVNIASRLQALAPAGGIYISEAVHKNISNKRGIESTFIREEILKNVKDPVLIYEVDIDSVHDDHTLHYSNTIPLENEIPFDEEKHNITIRQFMRWGMPILVLGGLSIFIVLPWINKLNARTKLLPAIQQLVADNFRPPTQAFDMAMEAEKYISKDSALIKLWPTLATAIDIESNPPGAEVFWKDYQTPGANWRSAGITPLKNVRFPRGYLRMEFRKEGYQPIEYAGPWSYGRIGPDIAQLKLDSIGNLPSGMIRIPKQETQMYIVGLEQQGPKEVGEFLIDRYEVTNRQFKTFIDQGGYTNTRYWKNTIIDAQGKEISLATAISLFTDRTGRQGPANWEAGMYPDGQEEHPVTGISWYEAAAYAEYAQKQLPTVFHWGVVAATSRTEFIVPLSNFNGKSTTPVGSMMGYSTFGVYDLAGNAREWCQNESEESGHRYILGGGWNDPTYSFNDSYTQAALDRSITNGFRCMKTLPGDSILVTLINPVKAVFRDYRKEKPVDDKTFAIYESQFTYDKKALNEKTEASIESEFWKMEKISFDAGYNDERMDAYIYLPKNSKPPYQAILYFSGSGDIYSKKFNPDFLTGRIDFLLKNGRAIICPVYKGTFERHDDLKSDLPEPTVFYKDHVIMWRKDIGRTIDYLETRKDIQIEKIGYLGWSWGGFMGGILPALEKRIKAVVLNVGGMAMTDALPEVDQINFLPRIKQPVLMLNGKHDMYFPVETSQKPMFNFLGTPEADKKIIIYESGHLVPRTDFMKETLLWYDKYLGPVK